MAEICFHNILLAVFKGYILDICQIYLLGLSMGTQLIKVTGKCFVLALLRSVDG